MSIILSFAPPFGLPGWPGWLRRLGWVRRLRLTSVDLLVEPRDLWVGVFWNVDGWGAARQVSVYVALVPILVIKLTWRSW